VNRGDVVKSWMSRNTNVFRSDRLDQDLDDEQRFHLKARADELEERGVSREAACDRPHGGFEHDRVLIASTATDGYSVDQRKTFYALLLDNVRRIPGVVSAALANDAPLDVNTGWNILVQRDPAGPPRQAGASVAFILQTISRPWASLW
jgi:hypothetical protein